MPLAEGGGKAGLIGVQPFRPSLSLDGAGHTEKGALIVPRLRILKLQRDIHCPTPRLKR
jgi:hypothetical protein